MPGSLSCAPGRQDRIELDEEVKWRDRCCKIVDCLRCDFLPECHMGQAEVRDRRHTLRSSPFLFDPWTNRAGVFPLITLNFQETRARGWMLR